MELRCSSLAVVPRDGRRVEDRNRLLLGPLERGSEARALGIAESFKRSLPGLKRLCGPTSELFRFKLLGIKQVELLPEDEVAETSLGLVNRLLLLRQSTLGRKVQGVESKCRPATAGESRWLAALRSTALPPSRAPVC